MYSEESLGILNSIKYRIKLYRAVAAHHSPPTIAKEESRPLASVLLGAVSFCYFDYSMFHIFTYFNPNAQWTMMRLNREIGL